MTKLDISVGMDAHRIALDQAENSASQQVDAKVAGKAGLDELATYIRPIWDDIRIAIESAASTGEARVKKVWQAALEKLSEISQAKDVAVEKLSALLQERLSAYVRGVEELILSSVSASINAGGVEMGLQSVELTKTVKMSNSFKASLEAALEFASGGELSVAANYEANSRRQ